MSLRRTVGILSLPALSLSFLPGSAGAQSFWLGTDQQTQVSLEVLFPRFDEDVEVDFPTSSWTAGLRYRLPGMVLVTEIPFSFVSPEQGSGDQGIGNIYVGGETIETGGHAFAEFGVYLPTAGDELDGPTLVGLVSDLDRWESYFGDYLPVVAAVDYRPVSPDGLGVRARGAFSVLLSTDDGDSEGMLLFGLKGFYRGEAASFQGGFTARFLLTEEGDFDERLFTQVGLVGELRSGSVRPGASLRISGDDDFLSGLVDFTVGVHVAYTPPE